MSERHHNVPLGTWFNTSNLGQIRYPHIYIYNTTLKIQQYYYYVLNASLLNTTVMMI